MAPTAASQALVTSLGLEAVPIAPIAQPEGDCHDKRVSKRTALEKRLAKARSLLAQREREAKKAAQERAAADRDVEQARQWLRWRLTKEERLHAEVALLRQQLRRKQRRSVGKHGHAGVRRESLRLSARALERAP